MQLKEFPRLSELMRLMGVDNGADVNSEAVIPPDYERCARVAELELATLSADEMEMLAYGEETESEKVARHCPEASQFLNAAFDDGDLSEIVFIAWHTALDSLDADGSPKSEKAQNPLAGVSRAMIRDCIIIFCADCGILTSPNFLLSEPWTLKEEDAMREYLLYLHRKQVHKESNAR